jgi:predicted ArsR family transcriptional regulator
MAETPWKLKKLHGTRNKIIQLLRKRHYLVEELAGELGVTKNAIRAQIALLQRDGIVESIGEIKGTRRPALTYGLSSDMDLFFSNAYPTVLAQLLVVLSKRMSQVKFKKIMKELGQELSRSKPSPTGSLRKRVESAVEFYEGLGAVMEVEEERGKLIIKGHGCPLAEVAKTNPSICIAVKSMLSELIGTPVQQRCDHGERPRCRFEVAKSRRISRR